MRTDLSFDGVEQARHLDMLLSLDKLKGIQWTAVAGQPSAAHHLPPPPAHAKGRQAADYHGAAGGHQAASRRAERQGLYLHCETGTVEEAQDLIRLTEHLSRE